MVGSGSSFTIVYARWPSNRAMRHAVYELEYESAGLRLLFPSTRSQAFKKYGFFFVGIWYYLKAQTHMSTSRYLLWGWFQACSASLCTATDKCCHNTHNAPCRGDNGSVVCDDTDISKEGNRSPCILGGVVTILPFHIPTSETVPDSETTPAPAVDGQ